MAMIKTTHGLKDEAELARTVGFEDRPGEFVVWVEWRLMGHTGVGCPICADPGQPRPVLGNTLVRRDAHCILKEPSVVADALAATL